MLDPTWEWFCGVNSSYIDSSTPWLNNTCFINGLSVLPHVAFIALSSLLLIVLGCCTIYRSINTRYLLMYPGHSLRWFVESLLLLVLLAAIGEGILTDETYKAWQQPTQPHLYVPACVAVLACIMSLIYYYNMELWQAPAMAVPLMLYWMAAAGAEGLRLTSLRFQNQIDFTVLRFDLTVILFIFFGILFLVELYVILDKICFSSGKSELSDELRNPKMLYMNNYTSLLSYLTFWWVNWVFALGYKRTLEMSDLGDIGTANEARHNHKLFKESFVKEQGNTELKGKKASMLKVYAMVYGWKMLIAAGLKLAENLFALIPPLCVGGITAYTIAFAYPPDNFELPQPHYVTFSNYFANGFVLAVVMFVSSVLKLICTTWGSHIVVTESINVRTALQTMVYEKALLLSTFATTGGKMTMGQITNHMSTDTMSVMYMFQTIQFIWSTPVQLVITLVLLYFQMGLSALLGASVFAIVIPIQIKVASILTKRQIDVLGCSDKRLKQSNELLQGIKLLKLYAWEMIHCEAIERVRKLELGYLRRINDAIVITLFITSSTPILVTLVGFGTYTFLTGKELTPDMTFASLALFNQLAIPLLIFPFSLTMVVNAFVSSNRILDFLLGPEVEGKEPLVEGVKPVSPRKTSMSVKYHQPGQDPADDHKKTRTIGIQADVDEVDTEIATENNVSIVGLQGAVNSAFVDAHEGHLGPDVAVKITNGNFAWDPDSTNPAMSDINLEIPAGKLTIVIGQVGSGKSSLLHAILGEMTTLSGEIQINKENGTIAFAAQRPWLLNASLEDNILFASKLENRRYQNVIKACALGPDIDILPAGDQTEIGEKGINLSGGQKQRVSVARSMYCGRDIIILDDPLSALDVHVGRTLFEEGIVNWLLGNKQTVILVTHQLQYLHRADLIVEIKDGKIAAMGNLDEVIRYDPDTFTGWRKAMEQEDEQKESQTELEEKNKEERESLKRQISRKQSLVREMSKEEEKKIDGGIIEKEERVRGSVSYKVYLYYLRNIGGWLLVLVVLATIAQTSLIVATNFWLSAWSEAGLSNTTEVPLATYLGGYAGLSGAAMISQICAFFSLLWAGLIAAKRLHRNMLRNIIRVPVRFFDITPIGRVLNRFSNDTQVIDSRLSQMINGFVSAVFQVLAAVLVNTIVMPFFIVIIVPIAVAYYFLQRYFIATSRDLQRLDSTSKSPVFAFFSESLGGLSTIRAFGDTKRFYTTLIGRINENLVAFLYLQVANRWLAIRLDMIGAFFVLVAGVSTLVSSLYYGVDPSLVGLAVTYALQVSGYLNYLVRYVAEVELGMNAVERVKFYTDIDREHYEGVEPSKTWPSRGAITFRDVSVRYAKGLDAVIKKISITLKPGEKIGICGRTGSGKSTLTLALLRVIDIYEGQVLIDSVDIMSIPLLRLRSTISIIPQDPVLFTGTIRVNLDPEDNKSEDELWAALEIAQLKVVVTQLDNGLDSNVTEGGENFSVGQRQLFCLARAFLRKSRILIMDEATASIDLETDRILQNVVATAFKDRTVLTIAHRIDTILDSDSILVLDNGRLAEYGSPTELLAIEDGLFASLVKH